MAERTPDKGEVISSILIIPTSGLLRKGHYIVRMVANIQTMP